ncbi:MAG: hypothetical protein Q9M37_10440 [Desulfonauticus sp.]|nr:hypothetical protein [Desulfonauticus sp.]
MRVELESSRRKALSQRGVWMGEGIDSSEGAQDEASQHSAQQRFSNAPNRNFSKYRLIQIRQA